MLQQWFSPNSSIQVLAETYFDSEFSRWIEQRCLASGKLGGKSLGLLLAWRILSRNLPPDLIKSLHIPTSYFVGSDEFVNFTSGQGIRSKIVEGTVLQEGFLTTPLSKNLTDRLQMMLERMEGLPLIVRSSSVLEDQYGSSFAGIYKTVFCPNQGAISERLRQLERAIKQVYLSAFSVDAVNYRRKMGLSELPEEMAVLIQTVEGRIHGSLYFPDVAGIAFSKNPYCWTDRLNPEDGFVRLVWGLGSRAVQTIPDDYPRLIGLTNPQLRPETSQKDLFHYSQHFFDAINLENGTLETLPALPHLTDSYDGIRLIASALTDDGLQDIKTRLPPEVRPVITFQNLLESTSIIGTIDRCLKILSETLGNPINIEFSANFRTDLSVEIGLLQCRQLNWETSPDNAAIEPTDERIILKTDRFLYSGGKQNIEYLIIIDPVHYTDQLTRQEQLGLAKLINELNESVGEKGYFLCGPGRWGSTRPDLGVPVRFGDIHNAQVLLEIHQLPEDLFSSTYGTHFFLDLVETKTALLAIVPDIANDFIQEFNLKESENLIGEFAPNLSIASECVKVYHLPASQNLNLTTSPKQGTAFVYFSGNR